VEHPKKTKRKEERAFGSRFIYSSFFSSSLVRFVLSARKGERTLRKKNSSNIRMKHWAATCFFPIHLFLLLVGRSVFSFFSSFDYFASSSPLSLLSLADHNCSFFSPQARVVSFFFLLSKLCTITKFDLSPLCVFPPCSFAVVSNVCASVQRRGENEKHKGGVRKRPKKKESKKKMDETRARTKKERERQTEF